MQHRELSRKVSSLWCERLFVDSRTPFRTEAVRERIEGRIRAVGGGALLVLCLRGHMAVVQVIPVTCVCT